MALTAASTPFPPDPVGCSDPTCPDPGCRHPHCWRLPSGGQPCRHPGCSSSRRAHLVTADRAARQGRMRYGAPTPPTTERLEARVRAHRYRIGLIDAQAAELATERRRLVTEVAGFEKALALVLAAEAERRAAEYGEAWSPTPIRAYRVWRIIDGRLSGARMVWPEPHLVARCIRGGDIEVPHTDNSCPRPQCGIYAAKRPDLLIAELSGSTRGVLGLVELSGKVVEHEKGYRAREARVVALGAVGGARLLLADDPVTIAEMFTDPATTLRVWGRRCDRRPALAELTEYLLAREESTPWT